MLNKEGNLKEHVKETESKASRIIREINGISSKQNVGQEEIRVKIKFFETSRTSNSLKHGWGQNTKAK